MVLTDEDYFVEFCFLPVRLQLSSILLSLSEFYNTILKKLIYKKHQPSSNLSQLLLANEKQKSEENSQFAKPKFLL